MRGFKMNDMERGILACASCPFKTKIRCLVF